MKLSAKTIQILKNFSSINPSIMFNTGNVLSTISPIKTVMARAQMIDETIEKDFGIFDLNRFLGVLSLFDDPELLLCDNYVKVTDGRKSVNFIYADPITMILPPNKDIKVGESYVEFNLTADNLQNLMRASSVLQLPEIALVGEDGRLLLRAMDSKNSSNNTFELEVKETSKTFKIIFSCNNLKMMSKSYDVFVAKGIGHFVSDDGVQYWITTESTSTYED
jgi:hypothetical protein